MHVGRLPQPVVAGFHCVTENDRIFFPVFFSKVSTVRAGVHNGDMLADRIFIFLRLFPDGAASYDLRKFAYPQHMAAQGVAAISIFSTSSQRFHSFLPQMEIVYVVKDRHCRPCQILKVLCFW